MGTDRYQLASRVYDFAALTYSGGAIWRTREACLRAAGLGAHDRRRESRTTAARVLIPGPGTGRLAVLAAAQGAEVVGVERSAAMLARAARRARRARVPVRWIRGGLDALSANARFDLVVAEHFLNVFPPGAMTAVRARLIDHVAPGGHFAVADFAPIDRERSAPLRRLQEIHHVLPLAGCAMLTRNAMHPVYDHGEDLRDHGDLTLVRTFDARSFRVGPRWFRTWIFRRASTLRADD